VDSEKDQRIHPISEKERGFFIFGSFGVKKKSSGAWTAITERFRITIPFRHPFMLSCKEKKGNAKKIDLTLVPLMLRK